MNSKKCELMESTLPPSGTPDNGNRYKSLGGKQAFSLQTHMRKHFLNLTRVRPGCAVLQQLMSPRCGQRDL